MVMGYLSSWSTITGSHIDSVGGWGGLFYQFICVPRDEARGGEGLSITVALQRCNRLAVLFPW